mmetsp:Transcript_30038/g.42592  ORF Transcript_30038/g.42592 Transcript_30038/m.42592 type:complete len:159 (-) Transcript_30038:200-676(-)
MTSIFEQENVPEGKVFRASTRDNSHNKWQTKHVVGSMEVESEPVLNVRSDLRPLNPKVTREARWREAQNAWDELFLRKTFIEASESIPIELCCCGFLPDNTATIKKISLHLNQTWVKDANKKLQGRGFKVDTFVWSWHNLSGQSQTHILLIRFHDLKG